MSFFFLILLSCMVSSNRDLGNKQFYSSAFTYSTTQMAQLPTGSVMDVDKFDISTKIRRRSYSSSKTTTRSTLIFSSTSSTPYHERMEINNDFPNDNFKELIDSSLLLYKDNS